MLQYLSEGLVPQEKTFLCQRPEQKQVSPANLALENLNIGKLQISTYLM